MYKEFSIFHRGVGKTIKAHALLRGHYTLRHDGDN